MGTEVSGSPLAAAFASVMGWAFDLFDLFILLYVAGPVGHQIFPVKSETLSLALVFISFAVSILMRPGGAAIFGSFADRMGRKRIMVIVFAGVGVSTAVMGLVPSYAAVGMVAPVLFLALRVIQGIFVGGVTAVTHTLGTESVPARYRGLMSGLIGGGGAGIGAALASIAFITISAIYPGPAFIETGWRYMFATGLLGALLSLFVLRKVEESPLWLAAKNAKVSDKQASKPLSFKDLLSGRYGRITVLNIAVAAGAGAQYYLTSGFLPTYLDVVTPVPRDDRGWILLGASLIVVLAATSAGHLSERLGRRRTMLMIGTINLVALPVILLVIARTDPGATVTILILCCLLATLSNAAYAPVMIFLNERYPTEIRSRGTAVSWNTGFMLGGLLPTFVTLLSPTTADIPGRLMIFIAGAVLVFIIAAARSPETRGAIEQHATVTFPSAATIEEGTNAKPL
ncbi:MFS transporter [Intrasporangium chromatireducens Q5-1]|uniref:MFS transporter n=1 Tax=Intrasporangium chromatireducens Q5-1 TaxID=584657 RepID=W9GM16_9MICO|nr:MFS transporter [Intrasporangium chromatireducens Q5-1]